MKFKLLTVALAAAVLGQAHAANVIQNGGFEADGHFVQSPDAISGWQVAEEGIFGGVMVNDSTLSPVSGYGTVGAASGSHYALIDLLAPSRASLSQTFTIGAGAVQSAILSFDSFVNYATIGAETAFSDAAQGLSLDVDNVQLRVDLLKVGVDAFSTQAADVLRSFAVSPALVAGPNAYQHYEFSLADLGLQAGQSYTLRFAGVNTLGSMQVGVDNVALNVTAVPEPESFALALVGVGLLLGVKARRR